MSDIPLQIESLERSLGNPLQWVHGRITVVTARDSKALS